MDFDDGFSDLRIRVWDADSYKVEKDVVIDHGDGNRIIVRDGGLIGPDGGHLLSAGNSEFLAVDGRRVEADGSVRGGDLNGQMAGGTGDDHLGGRGGDDIIHGGEGDDLFGRRQGERHAGQRRSDHTWRRFGPSG